MEGQHQLHDGDLQVVITGDPALGRYEGRIAGETVGEVDFALRGSVMTITHTGTRDAWRGQGIAGRMTEQVLADVRERGLTIIPQCPYTAGYVDQHPEHADLLA